MRKIIIMWNSEIFFHLLHSPLIHQFSHHPGLFFHIFLRFCSSWIPQPEVPFKKCFKLTWIMFSSNKIGLCIGLAINTPLPNDSRFLQSHQGKNKVLADIRKPKIHTTLFLASSIPTGAQNRKIDWQTVFHPNSRKSIGLLSIYWNGAKSNHKSPQFTPQKKVDIR